MREGNVQSQTLAASFVLAVTVVVVAALVGSMSFGAAVSLGLAIGSVNGFIIQLMLDRRMPILVTSFLRLALLSLLALAVARLSGLSVWPIVFGVGLAQLVMVGIGARQGLRA